MVGNMASGCVGVDAVIQQYPAVDDSFEISQHGHSPIERLSDSIYLASKR